MKGNLGGKIATRAAIYRSLPQNRQKSKKGSFWGVCKKVPKAPKISPKVQKCPKSLKTGPLGACFDLLGIFGEFLQTPQKTLVEFFFFAILGLEGRRLLQMAAWVAMGRLVHLPKKLYLWGFGRVASLNFSILLENFHPGGQS